MRKDRACGMPYMQPVQQGMMPGMYPMPIPTFETPNTDLTNLQQQVNNLERRVSKLESQLNDTSYNTNYSNTSYQMM